jgi:pyridoxal phosphate enzyme (YggS family)
VSVTDGDPGDERGPRQRIADNVARVRDGIAAACRRAGRSPESVTLVAVTKYVSADLTQLVLEAGVTDLAESRPQALWAKAETLATVLPPPRWHLVGHLQRNKLQRTLPLLAMLQTLDSLRLLHGIQAEADRLPVGERVRRDVLVEVNLTDDPGRSGVALADVPALVRAAAEAPAVQLRGLMGMAGHPDAEAADARRDFARLRTLRDELAATLPDPTMLAELSMGMSGDFEAGILEGATLVRIGSALFEGLT